MNLQAIQGVTHLRVRQRREIGEILTGWETKNRYEIEDPTGRTILWAGETGGGLGSLALRQFFGSKRPFTLEVKDLSGSTVLVMKRPWRWWLSYAEVFDGAGRPMGAIRQKFALLTRRYEVMAPGLTAELHGPFFKPWTFEIKVGGMTLGKIAKRWSGLLKESFTDADHFGVELGPTLDQRLRPLVLAATFLIDFVHFEKNT